MSNKMQLKTASLCLDFNTIDYDAYQSTHTLHPSCAEDIQEYFRLFHERKWEELFEDRNIVDAEFICLRFYANDSKGNSLGVRAERKLDCSITVNPNEFELASTIKLAEIKKIIG